MLVTDIVIIWIAALILIFLVLFAGALSIKDRENTITTFVPIGLILIGAIFVTIGQLVGFIGKW